MMLQQDEPSDYVIGMGEQYSVRKFVEIAFAHKDIEIEYVHSQFIDNVNKYIGCYNACLVFADGWERALTKLARTRRLIKLSCALTRATFAQLR